MKRIYLDYAATTPIDKEVEKAMKPYFALPGNGYRGIKFGNPNSLHFFGQEARKAVDQSRGKIANLIGAEFDEIIFTGSATEANNLALRGVVNFFINFQAGGFQNQNNFVPATKFSSPSARHSVFGGDQAGAPAGCSSSRPAFKQKILPFRIIVSGIEHESILETAKDLENDGIEVVYLPVDKNGIVDLKKLKESLNENTVLVSIMYANNEIGTIQPLFEISKIIKDFKNSKTFHFSPFILPLFHTDAVQAFQFLNCNVNNLGIDLMTLSAHKIYGPKGIGALYVRNLKPLTFNLKPVITGGGQEFGLRSGTENVPAIVGFAKAMELADKNREKEFKRILELRNHFVKELEKTFPKIKINGHFPFSIYHSPNLINIYFPKQSAEELLIKLDLNGVAVSSGSACASFSTKPSHALKALGYPEKRIKSSLRFSFGKFTTKEEIKNTLKILSRTLQK